MLFCLLPVRSGGEQIGVVGVAECCLRHIYSHPRTAYRNRRVLTLLLTAHFTLVVKCNHAGSGRCVAASTQAVREHLSRTAYLPDCRTAASSALAAQSTQSNPGSTVKSKYVLCSCHQRHAPPSAPAPTHPPDRGAAAAGQGARPPAPALALTSKGGVCTIQHLNQ